MQKSLKDLEPAEDATPEVCKQAYEDMFLLLLRSRAWVYSKTATSKCLVHDKQCSTVPQKHIPPLGPL